MTDESTMPLRAGDPFGIPLLFPDGGFRGSFAVRIPPPSGGQAPPPGSVDHPHGGRLVGFSRVCPHMGCCLLSDSGQGAIHFRPDDSRTELVCGPCPCHGTTFDLLRADIPGVHRRSDNRMIETTVQALSPEMTARLTKRYRLEDGQPLE